jgi:CubicO group peptidase (beta-lactamase class C family)
MAAGVLLDKGMLKLDDPIAKQLPDFLPSLPDGNRPSITVRQLLSHTAGLNYSFGEPEDGPYHKAGVSDGADDSGLSLTENLRRIASAPLLFAPGSSWRYSLATDVLGAVVAKAYAKDLPQAVRELVTEPLGMRDAAFSLDDDSRLAVPYFINPPREPERMKNNELVDLGGGMRIRFAPNRILNSRAYPSGGAGMAASAQDVMRLLEAIRKQGAPLVSPEIMREMVTPQTAPGVVEPGWSFALGWSVLDDPIKGHTPQAAGTIAWGGVYGHSWFVDFTNGISVVLLTNTTPEGMSGKLRQDVRDAVYAELKK